MDLPRLSLSHFRNGTEKQRTEFTRQLFVNFATCGFVKLCDHGFDEEDVGDMFEWVHYAHSSLNEKSLLKHCRAVNSSSFHATSGMLVHMCPDPHPSEGTVALEMRTWPSFILNGRARHRQKPEGITRQEQFAPTKKHCKLTENCGYRSFTTLARHKTHNFPIAGRRKRLSLDSARTWKQSMADSRRSRTIF